MYAGDITFLVGFAVIVVGMVFAWVEALAAWRFSPWIFRLGPRVLTMQVPLDPWPRMDSGRTGMTGSASYKILGDDHCLFRLRGVLGGQLVYTPFPIRGSILRRGSLASVDGRLSLAGIVIYAGWLFALTVACLSSWSGLGRYAVWILLGGWAFVAGIAWTSIRYELRRARRVVGEVSQSIMRTAA